MHGLPEIVYNVPTPFTSADSFQPNPHLLPPYQKIHIPTDSKAFPVSSLYLIKLPTPTPTPKQEVRIQHPQDEKVVITEKTLSVLLQVAPERAQSQREII